MTHEPLFTDRPRPVPPTFGVAARTLAAGLFLLVAPTALWQDVRAAAPCPPNTAPTPGGPSGTITNPRPAFSWSGVPGAASYTLYVLRVSDEAVVLRRTGITATSFTPASPLPSEVDLRWKVKGESGCGAGPYSPSVYFRVSTAPCPPTVAPTPGGPSGTIRSATPTFTWSAVPGATSYTLYVLRVSDEAIVLRQTGITTTSFTPAAPLPSGVALRWKVKGESPCGPGPYSASVYFDVSDTPCPPTAAPDPEGPSGTITTPTPTFAWTAVPGATSYTLYVLRVSDDSVVLRETGLTATAFTPSNPLPVGVELRWKVKGESSCGPGPYSPSVFFKVQAKVSITTPSEGAVLAGTVAVTVDAAPDVTRVDFYVDGVFQYRDTESPFEFSWDTLANPFPVPSHSMDLGYYFVEWKNPADFPQARAEVDEYTNLYYASRASYSSDLPVAEWQALLAQSLANAQAEEKRIHLGLEPEPQWGEVLDVAAPYWDSISRIEVGDEPRLSLAETEAMLQRLRAELSRRGLPHRPLGFTYVYNEPLPEAVDAPSLDWVGIEAYLDAPGNPVSQVNIDALSSHLAVAKARVAPEKQIVLVMMAYDRNGTWKDVDTLRDLQGVAYLHAYNDPRVTAIAMFAYTRAGGSRDHPELRTPHRLIGERILNLSVPEAGNGPRTLSVEGIDLAGDTARDRITVTVANPFRLAGAAVEPAPLEGKLLMGYQGWFGHPGDGSRFDDWSHWFHANLPDPRLVPDAEHLNVDMWPDTSEMEAEELQETHMTLADGSPARLFSSHNRKTVERHFKWMRDYDLDGVFLQRFTLGARSPADLDRVAENVRAAAEKHERVFAVMYDITGHDPDTLVGDLENDWVHLVLDLGLLESPAYLRHGDRPVLALWGLGFTDRPGAVAQARELIEFFKGGGPNPAPVTLVGGVPTHWYTLKPGEDAKTDDPPGWAEVYRMFDVVSPWHVGRARNEAEADLLLANHVRPELAELRRLGKEYMPVVFPGGSFFNAGRDPARYPLNEIPREGGKLLWRQVFNVLSAGCRLLYVAMFDEVDEATAIFKTVARKSGLPVEASDRMVSLDIDGYHMRSDRYLRLARQAGRALRGEIALSPRTPLIPREKEEKEQR